MSAPGWIECQLEVILALSPTYWRVVVHTLSKNRKSVRVGSCTIPQIHPLRCLETCKHCYEGQLTGHLTARWSSPVDSHISTYPLCRVYEAHIPVSSPLTFISDPTHLFFSPCQHLWSDWVELDRELLDWAPFELLAAERFVSPQRALLAQPYDPVDAGAVAP